MIGFSNFLKKIKKGNFSLIARNVTSIYVVLQSEFSRRFPDKQALLATAGIINAMRYIEAHKIETTEIIAMARSSIDLDKSFETENEIYELSSFIRQLETALFAIDTNMDYFDIREAVSQKFSTIRETVQEVLARYKRDKKTNGIWEKPTRGFMTLNTFKDLRSLIGIKDD